MSGGGEAAGVTGGQAVVGAVNIGLVGDADGGMGGGADGWDGNRDGQLIRWEDTTANVILGMEPNAPLAYAPGLEMHHPIMSILGGGRCQLEREVFH